MPDNIIDQEAITLRMYVDLLEKLSNGDLRGIKNLSEIEKRAIIELEKSGLISNEFENRETRHWAPKYYGLLVITPNGINSLESWKTSLYKNSIKSKVIVAVEKVLWIFVGAIITLLPSILGIT